MSLCIRYLPRGHEGTGCRVSDSLSAAIKRLTGCVPLEEAETTLLLLLLAAVALAVLAAAVLAALAARTTLLLLAALLGLAALAAALATRSMLGHLILTAPKFCAESACKI